MTPAEERALADAHDRVMAEGRAKLVARWPDFLLGLERCPTHGHVVRATATVLGKPMELSVLVDDHENPWAIRVAERVVLNGCLATLDAIAEVN